MKLLEMFLLLCALPAFAMESEFETSNLLINPNFEHIGPKGAPREWNVYAWGSRDGSFVEHDANGRGHFSIVQNNYKIGGMRLFQKIQLKERAKYKAKLMIKIEGSLRVFVRFLAGGRECNREIQNMKEGEWHNPEVLLTAPYSGSGEFCVDFRGDGKAFIDKIVLFKEIKGINANAQCFTNLIKQGSFDVAPTYWLPEGLCAQIVPGGYISPHALSLGKGIKYAEYHFIKIAPERKYKFSVWAKKAKGSANAKLELQLKSAYLDNKGKAHRSVKIFTLNGQWRQYSIEGEFPKFPEMQIIPTVSMPVGSALIDNVSLFLDNESEASAQKTASNFVEAAVVFPASHEGIFESGKPFNYELQCFCPSVKNKSIRLQIQVEDFYGKTINSNNAELLADNNGAAKKTFPLNINRLGPCRMLVKHNGELLAEKLFGVVRSHASPASERIGVHVRACVYGKDYQPAKWLTHELDVFKKLGLNINMRLMDQSFATAWKRVEPQKGVYRFADEEINIYSKYGFNFLGAFARAPEWAVEIPDSVKNPQKYQYCPPKNFDDFEEFVFRTVSHYKDKIKYWEVWNEPYGHFWYGTIDELVELHKRAYRAIKKADPDAFVVGGCISPSHRHFTESFFKAGGLKYMDTLSFHWYFGDYSFEDRKRVRSEMKFIKERMKHYNNGKALPLWNTEGGCNSSGFYKSFSGSMIGAHTPIGKNSLEATANGLAKGLLDTFSFGAERLYYYFAAERESYSSLWNNWNLLGPGIQPKPTAYVLRAFLDVIGNADFKNRKIVRGVECFLFEKKNGDKILAINDVSRVAGSIKISHPKAGKIYDVFGNRELQDYPIQLDGRVYYIALPGGEVDSILKQLETNNIDNEKIIKGNIAKPFQTTPFLRADSIKKCNLRGVANMGLADDIKGDGKGGWTDEGSHNDMRDLKPGAHNFHNVPFIIIDPAANKGKAVVTLRSTSTGSALPVEVDIPFNDRADVLYFLHASGNTNNDMAGKYVICYKDGDRVEIPIRKGLCIEDWWHKPSYKEAYKAVPVKLGLGIQRCLYVYEWRNPHCKKSIEKILFKSECQNPTPILLGITYGTLTY